MIYKFWGNQQILKCKLRAEWIIYWQIQVMAAFDLCIYTKFHQFETVRSIRSWILITRNYGLPRALFV